MIVHKGKTYNEVADLVVDVEGQRDRCKDALYQLIEVARTAEETSKDEGVRRLLRPAIAEAQEAWKAP